jgi:hypothetical protein
MNCNHDFEVTEIKDIAKIDFHETKEKFLSKRWKYLKCKRCGKEKTDAVR